jgi:hypothetical protein
MAPAGVEPDDLFETAQLIDSEIARIGMFSKIAKSTVRSLYSHFPEFQELPNSISDGPHSRKEHAEVHG